MTARPGDGRVLVCSLGGTITMTGSPAQGVTPTLDAESLIAAVPGLAGVASVQTETLRSLPGAHLSFADVMAAAELIERELAGGASGAVVVQGTDTIEETAFLLDLLLEGDSPVVVTGAMRNPAAAGADGPANLLAAVQVAASPAARGFGVMVVMSDEIHAARFVRKTHATSPGAFRSSVGALGWVSEGRVRVLSGPLPRVRLPGRPRGRASAALLTVTFDDDGALLGALGDLGLDGLVVEAFGAGHVPAGLVEGLARLAGRMPVVLTSRTGAGETLRETYGFPGSERDLLARGLIPGGWLDGPKARVLLSALLRAGLEREGIRAFFEQYLGGSGDNPDGEASEGGGG